MNDFPTRYCIVKFVRSVYWVRVAFAVCLALFWFVTAFLVFAVWRHAIRKDAELSARIEMLERSPPVTIDASNGLFTVVLEEDGAKVDTIGGE